MVDLTRIQESTVEPEEAPITLDLKRVRGRKVVFQFDDQNWYCGPGVAHESPREPGVFYAPPNSTEEQPPMTLPSYTWPRWNPDTSRWTAEKIPESKKNTFIGWPLAGIKAYLERSGIFDYVINR